MPRRVPASLPLLASFSGRSTTAGLETGDSGPNEQNDQHQFEKSYLKMFGHGGSRWLGRGLTHNYASRRARPSREIAVIHKWQKLQIPSHQA